MRILFKLYLKIFSTVSRILYLVEIFLILRFVLKFLGASPRALVVKILYKGTDVLVFPFKFIFNNFFWKGHFVDTATLSAILGYVVFVFVFFKILKLFSEEGGR